MERQVENLKRQKHFAWGKVYENIEEQRELYSKIREMKSLLSPEMPKHFVEMFSEMASELKRKFNCPVCLEDVEKGAYKIGSCGHIYCEPCFGKLDRCAICRRSFS